MNLPMRLLLLAGIVTLFSTAFTKKSLSKETAHPAAATAAKQQQFYWYTYPYDQYNDQKTVADEEWELWCWYGFPVGTTPGGGTLLMKGYANNAYPHNQLPMVQLYGYFPFMLDAAPAKKAQ